MLLSQIKNIFHKELDALFSKEEVSSFFYLSIDHFLNLERFALVMQPSLVISKEEETPLFETISRLKQNEPIQYILGSTNFMDLDFKVTKDVLIPRPETEDLVRWIIDYCLVEGNQNLNILDIGTGSGCIAISLAKSVLNAKVFALDVSANALKIAKENAALNAVDITFLHKDILALTALDMKFDIIVSNPPYVRELEKKEMHENVLAHEPELALFVSDEDPLVFYKRITDFALVNLNEGGRLFFEINQYLGKETEQLLKAHNFSEIEQRKDIFGNERMLMGKRYYHVN